MEATSGDTSGSEGSSKQLIVQKSNLEYNFRPTTEPGLILKSPITCTQREQNNDSGAGAGANAESREKMVFVTTDPLAELVWSPHKGLGLKCADCNLADKKTYLWGMVLSPSPNITNGENNGVEHSAAENLSSLQTLHHLDYQVSDRMLIRSLSSTTSVVPICQPADLVHNPESGDGTKDVTMKEERAVLNKNYEPEDEKGKQVSCSVGLRPTKMSRIGRKMISNIPENVSLRGIDNGITTDSLSRKQNEEKLYSVQIEPESGDTEKVTSTGNRGVRGNSHPACVDSRPGYQNTTSNQLKLPDSPNQIFDSMANNHEALTSLIKPEGIKKIAAASSSILLGKGVFTAENDFEPLKDGSALVEEGITSPAADEEKWSDFLNGALPLNEVALYEASPTNSRNLLYQKKNKEKFLCTAEVDVKILKNSEDSHESVESCNNSTAVILAGKRPWSFDQKPVTGNKKMKKQNHESPDCTPVQRQGSSFMNWISNMVKGSSKSDLKETTYLDLVMTPSHPERRSDDHHSMLQERNQQSGCTSTGFGTVFKALYCSGINVPDTGMSNINHQLVEGSKYLDQANRACDNRGIPVSYSEENVKLCEETGISTQNLVKWEDGGDPLSPPNTLSANTFGIQEDHKTGAVGSINLVNIPCNHDKELQTSSGSLFQNGLDSPSKDKETSRVVTGNQSLGSIWISRFCPKVSGHVKDLSQYKHSVDEAVQDPRCEDCQENCTEDHFDAVNTELQNCAVTAAGSCGSLIVKEHSNQNIKSTINTIKPSQRFINSEAMSSIFSRRLDVLRHIMSSEREGNTIHATKSCIFCGISGHTLQECAEITEAELAALLKKVDSCVGAKEPSCLCICCFQLNHWAISCPNISSRKRSLLDGSSSFLDFRNFDKTLRIPRSDAITKDEEKNPSDNMGCGSTVALTVSDGKKAREDNGFGSDREFNKKVNDVIIQSRCYSDSELTKKGRLESKICEVRSLRKTSSEFVHNGKHTRTSSSTENVSKEYQTTAFYKFVNQQIPAIPRGTFEAIKKLRLSRTDIFRWRRSAVSLFSLDGFFIRLRLRKWEKDLGNTGYYVAHINGGLKGKSSGNSKISLSVKIGGVRCSVECQFVSNHDFLEDELLAWWCATLKAGGNLPSETYLERKLKEKKSFGF